MPDEAPEETQDTPNAEPAAPDDGTPASESTEDSQAETQDTDWKSRYENLQPEYTRASQEAAELRQYKQVLELAKQGDQNAQRWIAEQLEWEIEADEEDEDETERPLEDPRFTQYLEAQREAQELESLESYVEDEIGKLAKAAGIEDLDDTETNLIFSALTPGQDGNPDVAKAFKTVTGLRDKHIKDYVAGKRKPPQAPSGSASSHQPDLDDPEQRREYIASRIGS